MTKDRLESLFKQHHQQAYLWACQCCGYKEDDAWDVLQNSYLKILEGKARYEERASFKTFLYSVIRFTAYDFNKGERKYQELDDLKIVEEEPIERTNTDYRKLLQKLPERQQQVLLMAFYHQLTLQEISDVIDLHIGTVRTHYERGKIKLKELINKQ